MMVWLSARTRLHRDEDVSADGLPVADGRLTHFVERQARLGGDQLRVDDNGNSEVSAEDYAIAIADLLENGGRERERITVAW